MGIDALRDRVRQDPGNPSAWRALADACFGAGLPAEADAAYQRATLVSVNDPVLREAALALAANRLEVAERLIKPYLKAHPTDVAAIRMLAELAARIGRLEDAESLLTRALELAPGFLAARQNMAMLYLRTHRLAEALAEAQSLLEQEPENPAFLNLEGVALARIGDYADATHRFEAVLQRRPKSARIWLSYGHSLKTVGRSADSVAAYRRAIELQPSLGEAWWSLANLKSIRFGAPDTAAMEEALRTGRDAGNSLSDDDLLQLHFALGKAYEDAAAPEPAWRHYAEGNAIRARQLRFDPAPLEAMVQAGIGKLDAGFFEARRGQGDPAPDPIFIVGMPRSGTSLIEQILSTHPGVHGAGELTDLDAVVRSIGTASGRAGDAYPELARGLSTDDFRRLGEAYAERVWKLAPEAERITDKLPANFLHIGLIHLMLPHAKIIHAMRDPMDSCFSCYSRLFEGNNLDFSYDLGSVGRYYVRYIELMRHWQRVLPRGTLLDLRYEDMVADTEGQARRLLDYLELPWDERCLDFHRNRRVVKTASVAQVRRPIYRSSVARWKHFEAHLGPLLDIVQPYR